jgi:hypothetical protein
MTTPMDHDRCSEALWPFLRGELPPTEAETVATHLATCAECTEERDALAVMLAVEVEPLSSDERARLAQAVVAQRRAEVVAFAPRKALWRKRMSPALGAAALIAVVAVSAVWFGSASDDDGGGSGDALESATGGDTGTPSPDEESTDLDRQNRKRRAADRSTIAFENAGEDEATTSTESSSNQGEAAEPAAKSEPLVAGDTKGGGSGGGSGGDTTGETEPGPPDQTKKIATLSMSPSADTAEIGTCNAFTITAFDKSGDPVGGVTLDIEQRHALSQDDVPANEPDVGFCTPSDGPNPSAVDQSAGDLGPPQEDPDDLGTAGGETTGTTNVDGQVTIGIEVAPANGSDGSGDVTLVVFFDTSEDDDPGSNEPQDSATNTWVTPGQDRSPRPRATTDGGWLARVRGIF